MRSPPTPSDLRVRAELHAIQPDQIDYPSGVDTRSPKVAPIRADTTLRLLVLALRPGDADDAAGS